MLTLPIKKKWFDMILSGEKKEEYRKIKPYYTSRICTILHLEKSYNHLEYCLDKFTFKPVKVKLKNGYMCNSPAIICNVIFKIDKGKEEWGAEIGETYYVLKILSVGKEV